METKINQKKISDQLQHEETDCTGIFVGTKAITMFCQRYDNKHCKFKKSEDLPLDLLQYQRENSTEERMAQNILRYCYLRYCRRSRGRS